MKWGTHTLKVNTLDIVTDFLFINRHIKINNTQNESTTKSRISKNSVTKKKKKKLTVTSLNSPPKWKKTSDYEVLCVARKRFCTSCQHIVDWTKGCMWWPLIEKSHIRRRGRKHKAGSQSHLLTMEYFNKSVEEKWEFIKGFVALCADKDIPFGKKWELNTQRLSHVLELRFCDGWKKWEWTMVVIIMDGDFHLKCESNSFTFCFTHNV